MQPVAGPKVVILGVDDVLGQVAGDGPRRNPLAFLDVLRRGLDDLGGQLAEIPQLQAIRPHGQKILRRGEGKEFGHPLRLGAIRGRAEVAHRHAIGLGRVDVGHAQMRLAVIGRIAPVGHYGPGRRVGVPQLGPRHLGHADVLRKHVDRGQVVERDRPRRQRVAPAVPRRRMFPDQAHVSPGGLA